MYYPIFVRASSVFEKYICGRWITSLTNDAASRFYSQKMAKSFMYFRVKRTAQQAGPMPINCLNFGETTYDSRGVIGVRHMAGHSKWQNVQHIKADKDREKSKTCERYGRLVRIAVREGGSNPKLNSKLADVLSEAHKHNVPNSTLESAMKTTTSGKIKFGVIELFGPGGCFVILEYETESISVMRQALKHALKKYGLAIPQGEGRWRAAFEQKGILKVVGHANNEPLNSEKALDSAIEAGAEDVQSKMDEDDQPYLEFFCAPDDLHPVKKELEKMLYKIEDAYIAFIPNVTVQLSPKDMELAGNMLSDLEDFKDTVRIYENIQ